MRNGTKVIEISNPSHHMTYVFPKLLWGFVIIMILLVIIEGWKLNKAMQELDKVIEEGKN